ncbi:Nif3-like dinuclear metal center hexameric protein [Patescibacteria group bacterium]|nr:Nif3-like dinuclear metal center hexameric protein [Patescibacteria group bacterium]
MNQDGFDRQMKYLFSPKLAEFDFMGYLYHTQRRLRRVGVSLGLNLQTLRKALELNTDVLMVHNAPEELKSGGIYGKMRVVAEKANLSIYRIHLPLDFGKGGLIDCLCNLLGFQGKPAELNYNGVFISGGVYLIEKRLKFEELIERVRKINPASLRVAGKIRSSFKKIAITTGDGCKPEFLDQLRPDVFICGLLNQEAERIARDLNITIIEATSYATENEPLKFVFRRLEKVFKNLQLEFIDIGDSLSLIKSREGFLYEGGEERI